MERMKSPLSPVNGFFLLVILFFSWLMFRITWPFTSFRSDVGFLLSKQHVWHLVAWRIAFYTHIFSSLPVLLLGCLQFFPRIRKRYPRFHIRSGKLYVLIILVLAAPSGLVLGVYANGGAVAQISFCLLAVAWWLFTWTGYRNIRKGEPKRHAEFMIRSYALALSAITLRSYVFLLPAFFSLQGREMYVFVAWMSWVPNLLIAELLIRLFRRKRQAVRSARIHP